MGSIFKKANRLANKMQPHTWVMGEKASAGVDLGGQLVGAHDAYYQPEDIAAAPSPQVDDQAYVQRDRIRRMAKRAQGRDSTIRTGSTGAPYTGAPARLLGG
jgi:hypothetical protein